MKIDYSRTLEIEGPIAHCGDCRFATALRGKFSVEDGRLVWRADPDPQPGRGPDLDYCGESREAVTFRHVTVDGELLADEDVAALRATARAARSEQEPSHWLPVHLLKIGQQARQVLVGAEREERAVSRVASEVPGGLEAPE